MTTLIKRFVHTCRHVFGPIDCVGCRLPGSEFHGRGDECPMCGGTGELQQCGRCAIWEDAA